jgi:uncharacterized protein YifN (PemK superfamily)
MALKFPVHQGTILLCDYNTGFQPPEMVKRRPAIVVSPRLHARPGLATIVPLSTTAPNPAQPWHCEIVLQAALPGKFTATRMWAKADMVATLGLGRLDLFQVRNAAGARVPLYPRISATELKAVQTAMLHALGLGTLTPHL